MANNKKTKKLQKRDWIILFLFALIAATNWVWLEHHKAQDLSHESHVDAWLKQQVEINKLKYCIDENIRPCEIVP